jgi:hypothetical protein
LGYPSQVDVLDMPGLADATPEMYLSCDFSLLQTDGQIYFNSM